MRVGFSGSFVAQLKLRKIDDLGCAKVAHFTGSVPVGTSSGWAAQPVQAAAIRT